MMLLQTKDKFQEMTYKSQLKLVITIGLIFLYPLNTFCQSRKELKKKIDNNIKEIKEQSLTAKDRELLSEEEDADILFYEALKSFETVYRFDEALNNEKNINKIDLFYGITPLLKGKWKSYYLWISIILLLIVGYTDFFKYQITTNEQERDQNKVNSKTLLIKYTFILSVMFLPALYTSFVVGINRIIVSPINFIISDVVQNEDGEIKAKSKIEPAKVYNYYSSILYEQSTDWGFTKVYQDDKGNREEKSTISAFFEQAKVNTYYGIVSFINFLQNVANFVLNIISNTMVYILAMFFPLVILLNYIPGFQGGIMSVLKYVVNFSLFPVILKLLKSLTEEIGAGNVRAKLMGLLDSPIEEATASESYKIIQIINDNMSFANLSILIILLIMTMITPKITDMLISGSQSGAFFSAVTGMATAAITKGISLAKGGAKTSAGFLQGLAGKGTSQGAGLGEKLTNFMGSKTSQAGKGLSKTLQKFAKGTYGKKTKK